MKFGDIFTNHMHKGISIWIGSWIASYSEIVNKCVEPHVYGL